MFLLVGYMNVILHILSPQQINLKWVYNACWLIQKTAHTARASHTRSALPHAVHLPHFTDEPFTHSLSRNAL